MYVPAHFQPPHRTPDGALVELLARAPLVDLITHRAAPDGSPVLIATALPLLHHFGDEDADRGLPGSLVGHVARNNPHWHSASPPRAGDDDSGRPDSLVIVRGPDAYISPTWYAATAEHGRVVPTWNYLTAHVHGRLIAHDDEQWTFEVVRRLTEHFEAGFTPPWTVADPPEGFIAGQLRAIVGIEVVITSIEAKYKLSQNRPEADVAGAVAGLSGGSAPDRAVAAEMGALLAQRP